MTRWLALLFIAVSSSAFSAQEIAPPELLRHTETLSRDHFYLHFGKSSHYRKQNVIGGEHQTAYHILGFEGDIFQITVDSLEGEAMYSLSGEGYTSRKTALHTETITVLEQDYDQPGIWITVWLSAHPYAEYNITVTKQ